MRRAVTLLSALGLTALVGCGPTEAQIVPSGGCGGGCGANEVCDEETSTCACAPGFVDNGAACVGEGSGERSRTEVCRRWREGHTPASTASFEPGSGQCGAGSTPEAAIDDALARIALFRWLAGMDAVDHDPALDELAQACSVLAGWWDFQRPESPHTPSNDATCWSVEGALGAGNSNIAWGRPSAADSIDGFMEDAGANNVDALGHRRWILNPPLGPVGIGYWEGGGMFGNASCLHISRRRPGVRGPEWNAVPPAGFAPIEMTRWTWSLQGSLLGIAEANIRMERTDTGEGLPVEVRRLRPGAGEPAVSWVPLGWTPQANTTYRVEASGVGPSGVLSYDVTPVDCD